jgi:hypothetical protein
MVFGWPTVLVLVICITRRDMHSHHILLLQKSKILQNIV